MCPLMPSSRKCVVIVFMCLKLYGADVERLTYNQPKCKRSRELSELGILISTRKVYPYLKTVST